MSKSGVRPPPGPEIVAKVRKDHGAKTLLAFSGGKDSVCAALALRGNFDEVIPYSLYLVPDLEFVEETLFYYEKNLFDGQHIIRMPHPGFYLWLNSGAYQSPENFAIIKAARLPYFDFADVQKLIKDELGIPKAYTATGVRASDSPMRHVSIMQHGAILKSKKEYFPVWDAKKADLVEMIKKSGLKLAVDYLVFGRSFDGLDCRFLLPLKKHFPGDYRRILEFFPLVEAEVFRAERMT